VFLPAFAQTAGEFLAEGNKAYAARDYTNAAAHYQDALKADPNFAGAYQGLGNCDLQLGKKAEALAYYEKALKLNPDNPRLSQAVGFLREKAPNGTVMAGFSPTPCPTPSPALDSRVEIQPSPAVSSKADEKTCQLRFYQKAKELAEANKDRKNFALLDLVNGEIWNQGVRYKIPQLYLLAPKGPWTVKKSLEKRDPSGHAQWLYQILNLSLKCYQNRPRGIFSLKPPSQPGGFETETVEGVSFQSTDGEVQKAFQNDYFTYDGEEDSEGQRVLKFKHVRDLDFDDKLEVYFDPSGKMTGLRYGVLDEH
jgi:tetratricopeptide (TPR) repeat protein